MGDLIDRQAAIDALDKLCDRECEYSKKQRSVMCGACHLGSAFDVVEALPSAQPERKKGKWIIRDNPGTGWYRVTCSECGEDVTSTIPMIGFFPNAKPLWNYCPDCGAKMEDENE